MQLLGFIFFILTAIFYVGLAILNMSKPTLNGNDAMGYGLALLFLTIGFAISSLLLTILIRSKGSFDWVAQEAATRTAVVLLAWLMIALTIFFCTIFKWEWRAESLYPPFLHWIALTQGQLWIPLPWLIACLLSLNPGWQTTLSLPLITIPFWVGLSMSAVFSSGLLVGYVREADQRAQAEVARQIDQQTQQHQLNLNEIAAYKPQDSLVGLLVFTTRYHEEDVRQAALAKIKAHPDWEAKLLALLANQYYYQEVYSFLGSNRVDHPAMFAQPLNLSIDRLSVSIQTGIDDSNNLQDWTFDSYGIGHLLRAIDDQFQQQGVDYYPGVLRLQQALNTPPPERFKGIRFTVSAEVDRWLVAHKK
ncbi:hypothetical protein EXU85_24430 [Spirosoma sp. KCTC 42546]|uniref:hypothetical protein n=1 Tax=Spirosoma sp. KCTC 42546 TaxID=2520506 RepID=UPI00115AB80A|nr:hypothetical protein [Spirosoma sp. KCTC 42546]QDK81586.1 hypothetical protein EXU85_24430 [Spirosoma sp. KCTC 42546]